MSASSTPQKAARGAAASAAAPAAAPTPENTMNISIEEFQMLNQTMLQLKNDKYEAASREKQLRQQLAEKDALLSAEKAKQDTNSVRYQNQQIHISTLQQSIAALTEQLQQQKQQNSDLQQNLLLRAADHSKHQNHLHQLENSFEILSSDYISIFTKNALQSIVISRQNQELESLAVLHSQHAQIEQQYAQISQEHTQTVLQLTQNQQLVKQLQQQLQKLRRTHSAASAAAQAAPGSPSPRLATPSSPIPSSHQAIPVVTAAATADEQQSSSIDEETVILIQRVAEMQKDKWHMDERCRLLEQQLLREKRECSRLSDLLLQFQQLGPQTSPAASLASSGSFSGSLKSLFGGASPTQQPSTSTQASYQELLVKNTSLLHQLNDLSLEMLELRRSMESSK